MLFVPVSPEYIRKVRVALAECDRYIELEEPRDSDLRPIKVQQHLDFCKAHKVKLMKMLESV